MRDVFAAGRVANKREVLEHLQACAEQAHRDQLDHPCHFHEIEAARANQRVADYLHDHPELAA